MTRRRLANPCLTYAVIPPAERPLDLWAPSAAWIAPSAEDRARARAVVEAADRERELEEAEWSEALADARRALVPPVSDCTEPTRASWLDRVGVALCLAPVAAIAAYAAHLVHWL